MTSNEAIMQLVRAGNKALAKKCNIQKTSAEWLELGAELAAIGAVYGQCIGNDGRLDDEEVDKLNRAIETIVTKRCRDAKLGWLQALVVNSVIKGVTARLEDA